MYYDTHSHPYLAKEKSQEEILENFFSSGGVHLNTIGCDIESSQLCINLAQDATGVYASIGIHPTHTLEYKDTLGETLNALEKMYHKNSDNIVAIGEIGLDYHWLSSLSERYNVSEHEVVRIQKEFFIAQIKLAKKLELPIIIHNRSSADDVFETLKQQDCINFVFHCYSEDVEYARRLLKFAPDCMIGFGGVVTFKSALGVQKAAQGIPLKNIIIETDSPYLTPAPLRGKQENEPILVQHVLSKIIDLRDEDSQEISDQILKNSESFFGVR